MIKKERLKRWSQQEIEHLHHTLENPKPRHVHIIRRLHHFHFWTLILAVIMADIILVGLMIPLILIVPSPWIFYTVAIIALGFGILFNWLVLQIEHLDAEHHALGLLIIPFLTIIDVLIVMGVTENIEKLLGLSLLLKIHARADVVMFLFGVGFMLPYFIWLILGKHRKE